MTMSLLSIYLLIGTGCAGALVFSGIAARGIDFVRHEIEARGLRFPRWVPYVALGFVMLVWPVFLAMMLVPGRR
jgi:hypothetical protein